jgi:single-strand DNA-binding protein
MAEIMSGIECAFLARVGSDPELKTYQGDKPMGVVRVGVGDGDNTQWVGVVTFGERAHALVQGLQKGTRVYIEGKIKLDSYTAKDGTPRSGLKVSASKIERLGEIGMRKPGVPSVKPQGDGARQAPPAAGTKRSNWQVPADEEFIPF